MKKIFFKDKKNYFFGILFCHFFFISSAAYALDQNVRDEFSTTTSYSNNDSTTSTDWATNWVETDDDGSSSTGSIRIEDDPDVATTPPDLYQLRVGGVTSIISIERQVNLSAATAASISVDYRRQDLGGAESVKLQVSSDGTTWFDLATYSNGTDAAYTTASYTIPVGNFSANTRIRILTNNKLSGTEAVYFDNIQVTYTVPDPPAHFSISHSSSNYICQNEKITITKHNSDHSVDTAYTGTITLSTSTGNGDWSKTATTTDAEGTLTPGASDTGAATYVFDSADNGTIILNLYNSNSETLNINILAGTETEYSTEDADLTFTNIYPTTYRDNFSTVSYSNNDGSFNWSTGWIETNDDSQPNGGVILITDHLSSSRLQITGDSTTARSIEREVNLTGKTSATLSFNYYATLGNGETVIVEASSNGGTSWTTLDSTTLNGVRNDNTYQTSSTYNLTSYISANTRIRFRDEGTNPLDSADFVYIDNIEITANFTIDSACLVLDHYAINYSSGATGTGVNCQKENITIAAHDINHDIYQFQTGSVSLTTSTANGNWSKTATTTDAQGTLTPSTSSDDSGVASYEFVANDLGSAILNFENTNAEATNLNINASSGIKETSNSAVAADDYEVTFSTSAFNFLANSTNNALGLQIGGKRSDVAPGNQTLELQASSCESGFTGVTAVEVAVECIEPSGCTGDKLYISTDNGTSFDQLDSTPELTYTNILDFDFGDDTDSTAPIIIRYDDVGKIKLHARKTLPPSNVQMSGQSNEFVVRPFAFNVNVPSNPAATGPAGTVFIAAGVDFPVNVSAVLWEAADDDGSPSGTASDGIADGHELTDTDPTNNVNLSDNTVALNYGQHTSVEQVELFSLLNQPAAGNNPNLDDSSANSQKITSFTSGAGSTSTINYDEVGIIELYAKVADNDYLGITSTETDKIAGRSGYVGRFIPHHFDTTVADSCGTFTYSGQPFSVTTTARNLGSASTTQNYTGTFAFDSTITNAAVGDAANFNSTNTILAASYSNGTASKTDVAYTFPTKETAPSTIRLRANDADTGTSSGDTEGTTEIRSGRIRLENVFGPSLSPLTMALMVEYYDDGFTTNTADSCTTYETNPNLLENYLKNFTGNMAANKIDATGTGTGTVVNGLASFIFHEENGLTTSGPGLGNEGSVSLLLSNAANWLNYEWGIDCDNDDNTGYSTGAGLGYDGAACGTASFGYYRGDDRIIYWREVF